MGHIEISSREQLDNLLKNTKGDKKFMGSNPSVHKVACPICKPKGIDGWIWRHTSGKWGRCTVCGFGGTIPV